MIAGGTPDFEHTLGDVVLSTRINDLTVHGVAFVRADPPAVTAPPPPEAQVVYYRLHGSPKIYYSEYSEPYLAALAKSIAGHERAGRRVWCIFDNTAEGAAVPNALSLLARLQRPGL